MFVGGIERIDSRAACRRIGTKKFVFLTLPTRESGKCRRIRYGLSTIRRSQLSQAELSRRGHSSGSCLPEALGEKQRPVRIKLLDGEVVRGWIEYYDRRMVRLTRDGAPNLFIYKHDIAYIAEEGTGAPSASHAAGRAPQTAPVRAGTGGPGRMIRYTPEIEPIIREAGALLISYLRRRIGYEYKGDVDLVTEADRASEKFIADRLRARWPEFGILGEEGTKSDLEAEYRWLVDPLDGTTNFAHGYPVFCISIALVRGEELIADSLRSHARRVLLLPSTAREQS